MLTNMSTTVGNLSLFSKKKGKKGVCGVLKLDFFFYHLIVITHLLSWVLPRPENDYAGFFFPSLQGSTEAPFSPFGPYSCHYNLLLNTNYTKGQIFKKKPLKKRFWTFGKSW